MVAFSQLRFFFSDYPSLCQVENKSIKRRIRPIPLQVICNSHWVAEWNCQFSLFHPVFQHWPKFWELKTDNSTQTFVISEMQQQVSTSKTDKLLLFLIISLYKVQFWTHNHRASLVMPDQQYIWWLRVHRAIMIPISQSGTTKTFARRLASGQSFLLHKLVWKTSPIKSLIFTCILQNTSWKICAIPHTRHPLGSLRNKDRH